MTVSQPQVQETVEIKAPGIKKILSKFEPWASIAEYVWNGFDAGATKIEIKTLTNGPLGGITEIAVIDNGNGIDYDLLQQKGYYYKLHKMQFEEKLVD